MIYPKIRVLITGVGGGSLGRELIKSFQMAKTKYKITSSDMSRMRSGLFETKSRYITPPANSPNYIPALLKICEKEKIQVIVPGSEPEIIQVVKNKNFFIEREIKILSNSLDIIKKCSDKFIQYEFLKNAGFKYPETYLFTTESNLREINTYPLVVKPRKGSGSQNIFIAHNFDELIFFTKYLKKYGIEPLIQEYIGDFEKEFTVGILYADNGKLQTSIVMKRILDNSLSVKQTISEPISGKKQKISTGISQGIFDHFPKIKDECEKIAKKLNANGPLNIQCRQTDLGIIPFEINPRFSATVASRSLVGHNEPDILCKYKMFNEIPKKTLFKSGYILRDLKETFHTQTEINSIPEYD